MALWVCRDRKRSAFRRILLPCLESEHREGQTQRGPVEEKQLLFLFPFPLWANKPHPVGSNGWKTDSPELNCPVWRMWPGSHSFTDWWLFWPLLFSSGQEVLNTTGMRSTPSLRVWLRNSSGKCFDAVVCCWDCTAVAASLKESEKFYQLMTLFCIVALCFECPSSCFHPEEIQ